MAKRLTAREIKRIRKLHGKGVSGFEIAARLKKSRPTIYKVIHSAPSNGAVPTKSNAHANSGGLKEIEAIVRREVNARLTKARAAALKALNESLAV